MVNFFDKIDQSFIIGIYIYLSIKAICCVFTAPSDEATCIDNRIDLVIDK